MNKKRFFEKFSESEPDSGSQNKPGNYKLFFCLYIVILIITVTF